MALLLFISCASNVLRVPTEVIASYCKRFRDDLGDNPMDIKFDLFEFDRRNSVLKLSGSVRDGKTHTPLPGTQIILHTDPNPDLPGESRINYATDVHGRFDFQATIYPDDTFLKIGFIGYDDYIYFIDNLLANRPSKFEPIETTAIQKYHERIPREDCRLIENCRLGGDCRLMDIIFERIEVDRKKNLIRMTGRILDKNSGEPAENAGILVYNYMHDKSRKTPRKRVDINAAGRFLFETEIRPQDELRFVIYYYRYNYCQEVYYIDRFFFSDQ